MDTQAIILSFLTSLYDKPELEGQYIEFRLMNQQNKTTNHFFLIDSDRIEHLAQEIKSLVEKASSEGKHVFYAPATRMTNQSGKKENCGYITSLWMDFDEVDGQKIKNLYGDEYTAARHELLERLQRTFPNSTIISSGNGYQIILPLTTPYPVQGNIDTIEAKMKFLALASNEVKGDLVTKDVSRVLRFPTSLNWKDINNPKHCEVIQVATDTIEFDKTPAYENTQKVGKPMTSAVPVVSNCLDYQSIREAIFQCEFIMFMYQHPDKQTEPLWFAMCSNLATLAIDFSDYLKEIHDIFHEISRGYANYSFDEAERKFNLSYDYFKDTQPMPVTYERIEEAGYALHMPCKEKSPAGRISAILRKKQNGSPVDVREQIENLVPLSSTVDTIKLAEKFTRTVIEELPESKVVKIQYIKMIFQHLGIPEKGNLVEFKKWVSDTVNVNFFIDTTHRVLDSHVLIAISDGVYEYVDGIYHPLMKRQIDQYINVELGNLYDKNGLENVKAYLVPHISINPQEVNNYRTKELIALQNGMLQLTTEGEPVLLPHDRQYYALAKLNIDYNPAAASPTFMEFLSNSFQHLSESDKNEQILFIQEFLGYLLIPGNQLQKALLIIGPGRNGKGVLLYVMEKMIGSQNVSAIPLHELHREYQTAHLFGKMANISGELVKGKHFNEDLFKSLTGEDKVNGRNPYGSPFDFRNEAKLIFASNHEPEITDRSIAIYERLLVLVMDRVVPATERDPHLKEKLELELEGILNFAIEGRRRLFQRGHFQPTRLMTEKLSMIQSNNNPVCLWFEEWNNNQARHKPFHTVKELFDDYRRFASDDGRKAFTKNVFIEELKKVDGVRVERRSRPDQLCVYIEQVSPDRTFTQNMDCFDESNF